MSALKPDASWHGLTALAEADAKPGRYYVTARDETGRTAFLVGPFMQPTWGREGHARALGALRAARRYVADNYPRSMGWTFGTSRISLYDPAPAGKLNGLLHAR